MRNNVIYGVFFLFLFCYNCGAIINGAQIIAVDKVLLETVDKL